MLRIRWELQAQRGGHQQVVEALEKASKKDDFPIPSPRISAIRFGQLYRICIEWEVENYAALDGYNEAMRGKRPHPVWQEIHPYLETGDTVEIWEAVV